MLRLLHRAIQLRAGKKRETENTADGLIIRNECETDLTDTDKIASFPRKGEKTVGAHCAHAEKKHRHLLFIEYIYIYIFFHSLPFSNKP